MSKKDYQAIAQVVYRTRQAHPAFSQHFDGVMSPAESLTEGLADVFAADNPRFDRARFIEACETGKCKGMKDEAVARG